MQRCRDLLTPEERASCAGFHREVDRRRAVVTRALVRTTLSRYLPVPPEAWRFERGVHGRPEIAAPAGPPLRFNLSHTRDLVACAVTLDADIGVDLEETSEDVDCLALATSVFSSEEIAGLRVLAPMERTRRFFQIWTLKEAYLKARGVGLALPPRNLSFVLRGASPVIVHLGSEAADHPPDWWFALLDAGADHLLALALKHRDRPVHLAMFRVTPPDPPIVTLEPCFFATSCEELPPSDRSSPRIRSPGPASLRLGRG